MKKLTRKSLNELAKTMPVIEESLQMSYVGGGNGTSANPYTQAEFDNMLSNDNWNGGYVEGMGYAIPINTAKPIIDQLIKQKTVDKSEQAYLGISGQTISSDMAAQMDMPQGALVRQVVRNSPAQKAGISAGDVIISFGGGTVSTMEGLKSKIESKKAGDTVKVVVKRQNQMGTYEKKTISVKLEKKTDDGSSGSTQNN